MVEELLINPYLWHVIAFTLLQAALSTALSLSLALPLARALSHSHFPGKNTLLRLMQFTWMLPSLAVVLGLIVVYGRHGWLSDLFHFAGLSYSFSFYGLTAILIAHLFLNVPLATRYIYHELQRIPNESWRLAAQLAMSPWQAFRYLEWPQVKTCFWGIGCLIFLLCFQSFTLVLALGGGPRFSTIEVAIYHAIKFDFDLPLAVSLAFFQIIFCSIVAIISFSSIKQSLSFSTIGTARQFIPSLKHKTDAIWFLLALFLVLPPIAAILFSGINTDFLSLIALPSFWKSVMTSLIAAILTALVSTKLALIISFYLRYLRTRQCGNPSRNTKIYSAFIETVALFNLIIPPTLLSMLFFLGLRSLADSYFIGILALIIINSMMSLPFTLRAVLNTTQEIGERYHKLTAALGFSFWQRMRLIELPLLRNSLANALAISALLSLGDFSVIAFFGSPSLETLPFFIYNLLASYQLEAAAAAVLLLIIISVFVLITIEKIVGGKHAHRG